MLITCPECEEIVSNQAECCPHCGCPNKYLIDVEPFDSFIIAKKVYHNTFGDGVVVSFVNGIIEIEFDGNDIKKFTLESFSKFFILEKTIIKLLMNEIKICEIKSKIENLSKSNEEETGESEIEISEVWEPPYYSNSDIDYQDYYESDDSGPDSISSTYAYYFGDE